MKHITEISNKELIAEIGNRMMNEYKNECKTNKQKYDTAKTHIICKIEIGEETINPLLYCKEFKQKTEYTEKYTVICSECVNALKAENAKLTEQLENSVVLPCKVGDTVYAIAKCCDVTRKLDGSYYSSDGSPGTATGWYCAFDGNEDKCPLCGEDECNENDYAIFETKVLGLSYSDSDDDNGWQIYLENLDTYESYYFTKSEAEARLAELKEEV